MECPHLVTKIPAGHITAKCKDRLCQSDSSWNCSVCDESQSVWMCMQCSKLGCGRYNNQHALMHYKKQKHPLAVNVDCLSCFCYKCNDFVTNTSAALDAFRGGLQKARNLDAESSEEGEDQQSNCDSTADGSISILKRKLEHDDIDNTESDKDNSDNKKMKRRGGRVVEPGKPGKPEQPNGAGAAGLRNLGNTCFMNATIQALSHTEIFRDFLIDLPNPPPKSVHPVNPPLSPTTRSSDHTSENVNLTSEMRELFLSLWECNTKLNARPPIISPHDFFSAIWCIMPSFRGYQQQDAHEFLRYVLDRVHSELCSDKSPTKNSTVQRSIVSEVFQGSILNEVKCLTCSRISERNDPIFDLSLDIPAEFHCNGRRIAASGGVKPPSCDIFDCLKLFTNLERLQSTELYMCNHCKKKQNSTKKFTINELPEVLCLHLKRFRWTATRSKVETHVDFPLTGLDMSEFTVDNIETSSCLKYDLISVIVHHGAGVGSGHYTAYTRSDVDNVWYKFNDSMVTVVSANVISNLKAYILFYRKCAANVDSTILDSSSDVEDHKRQRIHQEG